MWLHHGMAALHYILGDTLVPSAHLARLALRRLRPPHGRDGSERAAWTRGYWASLAILYVVWYLKRCVRPMRLKLGGAPAARLAGIVGRCPALHAKYWPTVWAPTDPLQLTLTGLRDASVYLGLTAPPYKREHVRLADGQEVALDWLEPAELQPGPVLVCLHGAFFGGSRTSQMADLATCAVKHGLPVLCSNRRGYGNTKLTVPKVSIVAASEDLKAVLQAVARRYPGREVALAGHSGGSLQAVRYAVDKKQEEMDAEMLQEGDEVVRNGGGAEGDEQLPCPALSSVVAIDYPFDISEIGVPLNMRYPYCKLTCILLYLAYGLRHRRTLKSANPDAFRKLSPVHTWPHRDAPVQAIRALRSYSSGTLDDAAWREFNCPNLSYVGVPCLVITSEDDPLVTPRLVDKFRGAMAANPNIAHLEMPSGGHGGKFSALGLGPSVFAEMALQFVLAAWSSKLEPGTERRTSTSSTSSAALGA